MATNRKVIFANNEIYHVFNRGVDKRSTFTNLKELKRAVATINFYQYSNLPMGYGKLLTLSKEARNNVIEQIQKHPKIVEIIAYCIMPNHFHFLIKQLQEHGITKFTSNFTNSYTKYFNYKNERSGHLFQGVFRSVYIEDNEQLLHLSRYIHLNPVTSFVIEKERLEFYDWSSYLEYLGLTKVILTNNTIVLKQFSSKEKYKEFVLDQADYARNLKLIEHLTLE